MRMFRRKMSRGRDEDGPSMPMHMPEHHSSDGPSNTDNFWADFAVLILALALGAIFLGVF